MTVNVARRCLLWLQSFSKAEQAANPLAAITAYLAGLLLAVSALCIVFGIDRWVSADMLAERKAQTIATLERSRVRLETTLASRLQLTHSLAGFANSRRHFTQSEFDIFAGRIHSAQPGTRSVQLAPDGIVRYVYPIHGNEAALGLNLLDQADQANNLQRAIATRQFNIVGPFELIQGGEALVARLPVFNEFATGQEAFWGFATVVIDFDEYLRASQLEDAASNVRFALVRASGDATPGEILYGDADVFDMAPQMVRINIAGADWRLAGAPGHGWSGTWPGRIWLWLGGVSIALAAGASLSLLLLPPMRLTLAVAAARSASAESESRFKNLLESSLQGVCIQRDGKILFANQSFASMFGYAMDDELFSLSTHALIAPHDRKRLHSYARSRSGNNDAPDTYEFDGIRRDGELISLLSYVRLISWEGQPALQSTLVDVTEKRRMESALLNSRETIRAIIDAVPVMICATDAQSRYVFVNQYQADQLGVGVRDAVGKTLSELVAHRPVSNAGVIGWVGGSDEVGADGVARFVDADGQEKVFSTHQATLPSPDGGAALTATIALDITDIKRAQEELNRSIAKLEQQNEQLNQFGYTVSHDLRSPLITIRSFIDLLEADLRDDVPSKVTADIEQIKLATGKMQSLLRDLLSLAQVGRVAGKFSLVPVGEIVADALALTAGIVKRAAVEVDVHDDFPSAYVDRTRLTEVFQNLIENSVKAMSDEAAPRLEIGVRYDRESPACFVRDNGFGLKADDCEKVFGLFHQLNKGNGGTGVGLAIVRQIVRAHGGEIWIESPGLGLGATVYLTLPDEAWVLRKSAD